MILEKKKNKEKHTETDGKEYNINRVENSSENHNYINIRYSNKISEEKQWLNDSDIPEDSENTKNKETINQNLNNTAKATKKIRDDGKRCKEVIYGKIEQKTKAWSRSMKSEKQDQSY